MRRSDIPHPPSPPPAQSKELCSCLRDCIQTFYEGPFTKQPHEGGPPRISGLTQYLVTDLLQALAKCNVNTADDLKALV